MCVFHVAMFLHWLCTSLLGMRDSEIAVRLQDVSSTAVAATAASSEHRERAAWQYQAGPFCQGLRVQLLAEHLGETADVRAGAVSLWRCWWMKDEHL